MNIVVVGHGLSPKNKGWGELIDHQDNLVLRMWNWHWQNSKDYGSRYDYGFYEISPVELKRFFRHNVRFPTKEWIAAKLKDYDGPLPEGSTCVLNPRGWINEAKDMGGSGKGKALKLTRGVQAAAWAIEEGPQQVILVGFDNVKEAVALSIEKGYPSEYVECKAAFPFRDYVGGGTKYSSHDYAIEQPFLARLSERLGVTLVHAQDKWGS